MGDKHFTLSEWAETRFEDYDCKEVYNEEIHELMQRVLDLCIRHKIPFYSIFNYKLGEDQKEHHVVSNMTPLSRTTTELLAIAKIAEDVTVGPTLLFDIFEAHNERIRYNQNLN